MTKKEIIETLSINLVSYIKKNKFPMNDVPDYFIVDYFQGLQEAVTSKANIKITITGKAPSFLIR